MRPIVKTFERERTLGIGPRDHLCRRAVIVRALELYTRIRDGNTVVAIEQMSFDNAFGKMKIDPRVRLTFDAIGQQRRRTFRARADGKDEVATLPRFRTRDSV